MTDPTRRSSAETDGASSLIHYPFRPGRSAVVAENGVVATSQPLAAQAGLEMLQRGGSAVDAAIATAAALTIVEPCSNGLGSDAFALVWAGGELHGLNGSGRWPRALSAQHFRDQGLDAVPERGWPGVSVPGAVDSWRALHERFGKLEFAELLAPAIRYAGGYPVSPVVSVMWARAYDILAPITAPGVANWAPVFAPAGRAPRVGERFASECIARGLQAIAERGPRDMYDGQIAEALVAYARATGGWLDADDLASHRSEWVAPISQRYNGHEVWEIPPNGQGIAALMALGMVEGTGHADAPYLSADSWHPQIEAMKLAFADAYRYVADPALADVPAAGMLDPNYLAERAALIGEEARAPEPGTPPKGGTVYLCTADGDGQMVSFIQSNYMGFGSGVVEPQFGISLQNRGAGFVLEEGHLNEGQPGKRPRHTIIPAFLTRDGEPVGPFGVMGGEMQPQGHLQVVHSMVDRGMNPQAALDAPRWQVEGNTVAVEPGTPEEVVAGLRERGHHVVVREDSYSFGRGQAIVRLPSGAYAAGSEPRADGAAVGF